MIEHDAAAFIRRRSDALTNQNAMSEIGPSGCWMIRAIALLETQTGSPASFFDGELMQKCGLKDQESLNETRHKAVATGWLAYEPGNAGMPGSYRTLTRPH